MHDLNRFLRYEGSKSAMAGSGRAGSDRLTTDIGSTLKDTDFLFPEAYRSNQYFTSYAFFLVTHMTVEGSSLCQSIINCIHIVFELY